ncbi:MAG: hypothetical protein ACP5T9_04070, partial [Thermoplasmata archaeon]
KVSITQPMPIKSTPVIEYIGNNGSNEDLFNQFWVLNRLKSELVKRGISIPNFPIHFKVSREIILDDISNGIFQTKNIYSLLKTSDKYVVQVSGELFYNPILMKYLVVALNGRLLLSNYFRSPPLSPEQLEGFQFWFYSEFYGEDMDYLSSSLAILTDEVLKNFAIFKYISSTKDPLTAVNSVSGPFFEVAKTAELVGIDRNKGEISLKVNGQLVVLSVQSKNI